MAVILTEDTPEGVGEVRLSNLKGVLLLTAGAVFLLVPRLTGWSGHHVHKEDGFIFLKQWTDEGLGSFFERYTGYLHVLPRAMTAVAAQFPPVSFPVVIALETVAFRVWLSVCLYWVMRSCGLTWRWAAVAASAFVVVPAGQYEVLGNVTNVRWFGDAALVVLMLGNLRGARAASVAVTVFLCAMSDPIAIALSPWLLWHLVRSRGAAARCVPGAALLGAGLQWVALDAGARQNFVHAWLMQPVELIGQCLVRGWQAAQFGVVATMAEHKILGWTLAMMLGVAPILLFVLARNKRALALVLMAMYVLATSIAFAAPRDLTITKWFAAGQPSRYSLAPAVVLFVAGVLASRAAWTMRGVRWLPILMGAILVLGVALDGRGDPKNSEGPTWATTVSDAQRRCTASHERAVPVEFTPTTNSHQWRTNISCEWLRR